MYVSIFHFIDYISIPYSKKKMEEVMKSFRTFVDEISHDVP